MRTYNILLVCLFLFTKTSGSPVGCDPRFPEIRYTNEPRTVRLKNVQTEKYVFMRIDGDDVVMGTKYLTSADDYEVEFTFHTFSTADRHGGVLVLPTSSHSRVFRVSTDRRLEVPALDNEFPEDPSNFRKADSSFFRLKRAADQAGNAVVLEAMNGVDCNYYLAVDGDDLTLKEYSGDSSDYPREIMFYEDDLFINLITSD